MNMDEVSFKRTYIATFLASWVANHYDDFCSRGLHKELENPPVEDAIELANAAWMKLQEVEE